MKRIAGGGHDFRPSIYCLRDILDDETMAQYSHISEIDIMHTASIMEGTMPSGIRFLEENEPEPQPPPPPPSPHIVVYDVSEYKCAWDTLFPPEKAFATYDECPDKKYENDNISHYLWDTFMLPASEL